MKISALDNLMVLDNDKIYTLWNLFVWKIGRRNPNFDIWKGLHLFYSLISQLAAWRNMTGTIALENSEIILNTAMRVNLSSAAFHF